MVSNERITKLRAKIDHLKGKKYGTGSRGRVDDMLFIRDWEEELSLLESKEKEVFFK